jgi:hypothetical protein
MDPWQSPLKPMPRSDVYGVAPRPKQLMYAPSTLVEIVVHRQSDLLNKCLNLFYVVNIKVSTNVFFNHASTRRN